MILVVMARRKDTYENDHAILVRSSFTEPGEYKTCTAL